MLTNKLDKSKAYARSYLLLFNKKCEKNQQYHIRFFNEGLMSKKLV